MILRILADAESEIDAARQYLNEQAAGLGARFLDEMAETIDAIANSSSCPRGERPAARPIPASRYRAGLRCPRTV